MCDHKPVWRDGFFLCNTCSKVFATAPLIPVPDYVECRTDADREP